MGGLRGVWLGFNLVRSLSNDEESSIVSCHETVCGFEAERTILSESKILTFPFLVVSLVLR